MKMSRICIVVPLYKNEFDQFEKTSVKQMFRVFKNYEFCFVVPNSMKVPHWLYDNTLTVFIKEFPDYYFMNKERYSELLLERSFYENFNEYEYILIHQLDAFVFSDRLVEFADLQYDYIGAPLNNRHWLEYHVGNGGLSLRKVRSFLNVLNYKESIMNHHRGRYFSEGEDNYFAFCGIKNNIDFTVPNEVIASRFAVQSNSFRGFDRIKIEGLPFGTHHFPGWNYWFWREKVCKQGYDLPKIQDVVSINTINDDSHFNELYETIISITKLIKKRELNAADFYIDRDYSYLLWGAGEWGYRVLRVFEALGLDVICVYDDNPLDSCIVSRIVKHPNIDEISCLLGKRKVKVQVSTRLGGYEIEGLLQGAGLEKGNDYIPFYAFEKGWEMAKRFQLEQKG